MATAARSRSRPARESAPRPRNDAYTGLLFISFVALVTSSILLFLDYIQYGGKTVPRLAIPDLGKSPIPAVPGAPAPDVPAAPADTPVPPDGAAPAGGAPMPMIPPGPPGPA